MDSEEAPDAAADQQPVSSEANQVAEAAGLHTAAAAGKVVQPAEVHVVGAHEKMDMDAGGQQLDHPAAAADGVQHSTPADDSMQTASDFNPSHVNDGMQTDVGQAVSATEAPLATFTDHSHHEAHAEGDADQHVDEYQNSQLSEGYATAGEAAVPQEYTEHEQSPEQYATGTGEQQPLDYSVHHYGAPSHGHTTGTSTGSPKKGLTFSGAPHVPKAKPYARADYSHSNNRLMKIAHDNQKLVERLTEVSRKAPNWSEDLAKTAPGNIASSAVNRRKAATDIAQENHALYQRLVAIKPSKDISRVSLEGDHRKHESYRLNCATFKPRSPTHSLTHDQQD